MIKVAVEKIEPYATLADDDDVALPLYNTQAELQLLSKLRSQSYRAYIADLAKLPESDISTKIDSSEIDIEREETTLTASSLLPTQREIYLDATLPKMKDNEVPKYFTDVVEIASPIVTFNSRFVIDGHHRWLSICLINPRAQISVINFKSETLTPIQFLKLLQGAIVLETGSLPEPPKDSYEIDVFHKSNKVISDYIEKTIPLKVLEDVSKHYELASTDRALSYVQQNALNIKYNNLPAVGSPSRELMPQTNNQLEVLDVVTEDAPVLLQNNEQE